MQMKMGHERARKEEDFAPIPEEIVLTEEKKANLIKSVASEVISEFEDLKKFKFETEGIKLDFESEVLKEYFYIQILKQVEKKIDDWCGPQISYTNLV
jgi:uncharacterized protein (DUF2164 family)